MELEEPTNLIAFPFLVSGALMQNVKDLVVFLFSLEILSVICTPAMLMIAASGSL
jgi:hypothetical protein